MEMNHIHEAIKKIGCLTFTTLEGDSMHSRIISVCGGDEEGIYPSIRKSGKNEVGQPDFAPGFTLRITGEVRSSSNLL